jgi:hypothetical protein
MAEYQQTVDYFKALSQQHNAIGHIDGEKEKFFRVNMEEFLSGSIRKLPAPEYGPAFILINYIKDIKAIPNSVLNTRQIMFYIVQGYKKDDYSAENSARDACEQAAEDFILRMQKDSRENHAFFKHSFDKIDKVRMAPVELRVVAGNFVGWQVSVYLDIPFNKCYDALKWAEV